MHARNFVFLSIYLEGLKMSLIAPFRSTFRKVHADSYPVASIIPMKCFQFLMIVNEKP